MSQDPTDDLQDVVAEISEISYQLEILKNGLMTRRDRFAMAAMQASYPHVAELGEFFTDNPEAYKWLARKAYLVADAMLEEAKRLDEVPRQKDEEMP